MKEKEREFKRATVEIPKTTDSHATMRLRRENHKITKKLSLWDLVKEDKRYSKDELEIVLKAIAQMETAKQKNISEAVNRAKEEKAVEIAISLLDTLPNIDISSVTGLDLEKVEKLYGRKKV